MYSASKSSKITSVLPLLFAFFASHSACLTPLVSIASSHFSARGVLINLWFFSSQWLHARPQFMGKPSDFSRSHLSLSVILAQTPIFSPFSLLCYFSVNFYTFPYFFKGRNLCVPALFCFSSRALCSQKSPFPIDFSDNYCIVCIFSLFPGLSGPNFAHF